MARILIVEDEEKIARFVTLELEHEGYQVEHAADGRTAVDLALERDYDLILLDVLLPQLNGMEVLRRVRKHKDVPVIMVTARDAVMDKVAGLDAGADDYLTKPFAIEELFARIRVALKRAEAVRRAKELLQLLRLSDRATHKPSALSGGEKQRVAVARALANHPAVILADEPSGSLDSRNRAELHALIFELRQKLGQTFVIVTHDEQLAADTDRVIHMVDGRILTNP